jgi:hypothetical protein
MLSYVITQSIDPDTQQLQCNNNPIAQKTLDALPFGNAQPRKLNSGNCMHYLGHDVLGASDQGDPKHSREVLVQGKPRCVMLTRSSNDTPIHTCHWHRKFTENEALKTGRSHNSKFYSRTPYSNIQLICSRIQPDYFTRAIGAFIRSHALHPVGLPICWRVDDLG